MAYLPIEDFGNPKAFTAYASDAIVAGEYVFASGADNVVNVSGAASYAASDIKVSADASGAQVVGMAVATAASGAKLAVQTQGLVVSPANSTVTASFPVWVDGSNAVANAGSATMASGYLGNTVGRALTSAASGGYCIVNLNL